MMVSILASILGAAVGTMLAYWLKKSTVDKRLALLEKRSQIMEDIINVIRYELFKEWTERLEKVERRSMAINDILRAVEVMWAERLEKLEAERLEKEDKAISLQAQQCAADNPDLPVEFIKDILVSKNQNHSLAEPFVFEGNTDEKESGNE